MSETYTVKQIAEILGYSTNSIYSFLKEGRIKGIRLGRGRFRITEEELERVLHLSKKPGVDLVQSDEVAAKTISSIPNIHFDITSLFDWFVGGVSILIGASLFLFSKSTSTINAQPLLVWIPTLEASLILGGLGLIVTDLLTDKISILWHRIFHLVMTISYFFFFLFATQIGNGGLVVLAWTLSFVLVLNIFRLLRGMESFLLFIILASCAVPLSLMIAPELFNIPEMFDFMLTNPNFYLPLWLLFLLIFGIILWWSHYKKRIVFWACMGIYGIILIIHSFYLANNLAWPNSFFMLFAGLTSLLVPAWESLHLHDHVERRTILPIFSLTTLMLLFIIGGIFVMEQNIKEYAKKELISKTAYGELVVNSTLDSIEKTLASLRDNNVLLEAADKDDGEKVNEILKIYFESNQYIRRIVLLDINGDLVTTYPYIKLLENNFGYRDYFKQVKLTQDIYNSGLFEAQTEDKRKVIVVSGPLLGKEGNLKGVIVLSVDLDRLAVRLQRIANEENGEYFILLDKNLRRIIHPNRLLIGNKVNAENMIGFSDDARDGIGEGYNFQNIMTIQAFHKMEKNGWIVVLQAPLIKIFAPTKAVSIGFFTFISLLVLTIGGFVVLERNRLGLRQRE